MMVIVSGKKGKGSRLGLMVKEDNCNVLILLKEKFKANTAKCQQLLGLGIWNI